LSGNRESGRLIGVEVIFGETDERLTIGHDAGSGAEPYIQALFWRFVE
jgi:hypothetical protein